jgi:hypothetical protein
MSKSWLHMNDAYIRISNPIIEALQKQTPGIDAYTL